MTHNVPVQSLIDHIKTAVDVDPWAKEMAEKLLKEQEPVAPVMVPHSRGIAWNCGACGTEIAVIRDTISADWQKNSIRFCQRCGRAVKWDAAD